ncbi:hypothetical protein AAFX24_17280 [Vibrio mediterranei]|uniref:hypothetical protein n=1 Tax=Vibrio mediterranei TaxID=689 RepID=UPI0038CE434D
MKKTDSSSLEVKDELNNNFNGALLSAVFKKSEAVRKCALEKNTVYDLSRSTYDAHKNTFKNAKLNADELLHEVMLKIRQVWEKGAK